MGDLDKKEIDVKIVGVYAFVRLMIHKRKLAVKAKAEEISQNKKKR